jgi:hypothetical protein
MLVLAAQHVRAEDVEALDELLDPPLDLSIPLSPPNAATGRFDPSRFIPKTPNSGWDGKAGIDNRPVLPDAAVRPERFVPNGSPEQGQGVAWANVAAPGLMILDRATFETRLDPQQQGKLGMNLSRSVPIGGSLSVTWQQGYAVTHSLPPSGTTSATTAAASVASNAIDGNQALRFTVLPANTTVSLGAAISSTDEKWLRSLSAEQKLFGGPVSITGTISETTSGTASKSLKAGIKRTW